MTTGSQIDQYLSSLRSHLGPIPLRQREEILREINAHIRDSAEQPGATVEEVLARLGSPAELASEYRDGLLIRSASRSYSPLVLLRGALRLATRGALGILVFFIGMFGYILGGGMILSALLKTVLPHNTGIWFANGHFLNSGTLLNPPPPPAHEVLGYWYVLAMVVPGSLTLLLTMYLIRSALRLSRVAQMRLG